MERANQCTNVPLLSFRPCYHLKRAGKIKNQGGGSGKGGRREGGRREGGKRGVMGEGEKSAHEGCQQIS